MRQNVNIIWEQRLAPADSQQEGGTWVLQLTELNLLITRMTLETESSQHLLNYSPTWPTHDFAFVKLGAEKPADQLDFYPVS